MKKESEKLVEDAKELVKEQKCVVDFEIDSVGAITTMVYGENGVKKVDLCYNDDTSKRKGAFMLRGITPDNEALMKTYCEQVGKTIETVKPNEEGFISWMRENLKKDPKEPSQISHIYWSGWDLETYDTKLEALSALLSGKAFNLGKTQKIEQEEPQPE